MLDGIRARESTVPAEHHPRTPLSGSTPHMASRSIYGPKVGPRRTPAFMEWELRAAEWVDTHPHDEFNVVLEGELHVTSGGATVVAGPGDLVRVPAGERGRYAAPAYARMLAVYDHSPDGAPSDIEGLTPLAP
jgi:uncharacterized cupin superfamily protein